NYAEACPKFRESERLDPRIATQFKLADCYEHIGRTASAWVNFLEVATATKAAGDAERERVARSRAAALEPTLSRLTVRVQDEGLAGLVVRRDGEIVGRPQWGIAVPVDPGEHEIGAEAPGKRAWQTKVRVPASAASISLVVPPLEQAPSASSGRDMSRSAAEAGSDAPDPGSPSGEVDTQPTERRGSGQRVAGIVIGSVGLVGAGVGAAFGLLAMSKQHDATGH